MNIPKKTKFSLTSTISIFTIFLLMLKTTLKATSQKPQIHLHVQNHLQLAQSHCDGTLYTDLCISTLSNIPHLHKKSLTEILRYVISVTEAEVRASATNISGLESVNRHTLSRLQHFAVRDCLELLADTTDELDTVLDEMTGQCGPSNNVSNIRTYLSAAMTYQYTCLDGFDVGSSKTLRRLIETGLLNITHHVSNSLAMLNKIRGPRHCKDKTMSSPPYHDDDLHDRNGLDRAGLPRWMEKKDWRLLHTAKPASPGSGTTTQVDIVVAKDGSGNFTTIREAVAAARNWSTTRFVIYIKTGAYFENVEVKKKKTNIMFLGDGIGKTVIKAKRNVADGYTTFRSATLGKFSITLSYFLNNFY